MARGQPLNVQPAKRGKGLFHAFGTGRHQVQPAQDGVDRPAGEVLNVFKGVDDARVAAAEQDHQPILRVKVKSLIVQEQIWPGRGGLEKEAAAGVFEGVLTGNLSGHEDALQDFRGLGRPDYACGRLADGLSARGIHSNWAASAVGITGELRRESGGVKKEPGFGCRLAGRIYSTCMVVVAVAQDDGFGVGKAEAQLEWEARCEISLIITL